MCSSDLDGFLAASVIIGKKLILLKAGNHLVVTAWVDVYDTLHQCCFELFAAFLCADVKAGSDTLTSVSYTHLDVYKRQMLYYPSCNLG